MTEFMLPGPPQDRDGVESARDSYTTACREDFYAEGMTMQAKVKFDNPGRGTRFDSLNLAFQGRGAIALGKAAVIFSGKQRRPLWFGRKATIEIRLRDIVNVDRSGRHIRFALPSPVPGPKATMFSLRRPSRRTRRRRSDGTCSGASIEDEMTNAKKPIEK